jgi:hypothetical protein
MPFRIFDHLLANHTWTATGRLCLAHAPSPVTNGIWLSQSETDVLHSRLLLRTKADRVLARAARRLNEVRVTRKELARELGVTERHLLTGLRAALGLDPAPLFDR